MQMNKRAGMTRRRAAGVPDLFELQAERTSRVKLLAPEPVRRIRGVPPPGLPEAVKLTRYQSSSREPIPSADHGWKMPCQRDVPSP